MNLESDSSLQVSAAACPLCGVLTDQVIAKELRRGEGLVRFCSACDHGFLVQANSVDLKEYYAEQYRQEYSHHAEVAATDARELLDVYRNYQQGRLDQIIPLLTPATRLLEVGASSGSFLVHIKDKVKTVNAIELNKVCCAFLSEELDIQSDTEYLENSIFADEEYDVVCAFQVMEHVDSPLEFLKGLRKSTKLDGVIFVEVPNLRDPLLSVWDITSYQKFFYHSAHIHYFSESSLQQVALRAGFKAEQIEISFTQDYNLLNHLHWIMNDGPQSNCHIGLSEVALSGGDQDMAKWLSMEMKALNAKYVSKLITKKCTSNMMIKLTNGK